MKSKLVGCLALALAFAFTLAVSARPGQGDRPRAQVRQTLVRPGNNLNKPVKLLGAILVPGNPLRKVEGKRQKAKGKR